MSNYQSRNYANLHETMKITRAILIVTFLTLFVLIFLHLSKAGYVHATWEASRATGAVTGLAAITVQVDLLQHDIFSTYCASSWCLGGLAFNLHTGSLST